jgi:hypothetical protein
MVRTMNLRNHRYIQGRRYRQANWRLPYLVYNIPDFFQGLMKARNPQFSEGVYFVYLSLCNPPSEKSCDIPFISVKLPKCMYSKYVQG